ncbi:MAG: hypothetical protein HOY71_04900 [Nonomuraea sp.]|nr:hypothetical protein [Nonomuraea sp.]
MSAVVVTAAGGAVEVERLVRESGVRSTALRPRAVAALLDDGRHGSTGSASSPR